MDEEFDFNAVDKQFDDMGIIFGEIAKTVVLPQYLAYRKEGLSVQESAALTAAMISHMMPVFSSKPQED